VVGEGVFEAAAEDAAFEDPNAPYHLRRPQHTFPALRTALFLSGLKCAKNSVRYPYVIDLKFLPSNQTLIVSGKSMAVQIEGGDHVFRSRPRYSNLFRQGIPIGSLGDLGIQALLRVQKAFIDDRTK
jgi:hypothetical protein